MRTLYKLGQCIKLLAGIVCGAFGTDTADVGSIVEYREAVSFHNVHQFDELHAKAQVGFIATIVLHGIGPRHTQERFSQFHTTQFLEQIFGHAFEQFDNIVLLNKRHFTVNLCKLRLTVGTQVFIAEALRNLEVTVETRYHQQLLQCLRALRQGIELTGIHTRRHYKVAGTFGSRTDEQRSLYFDEAFAVEVLAYFDGHLVTQLQILADCRTAQVQITVFHTDVVASVGIVFNGEGRSQGGVQYVQLGYNDFNVACRNVGVLAETFVHRTGNLNDIFASQVIGLLAKFGIHFLVEY
ncbi:putative uncharacterized protein [Bacteroides sp. CAG:633]|nr:putative uncharacterized protein [Bacteroides sp. CAG:633]